MALNNDQVTAQNFKDFYDSIRPYLNGEGGSGGHTIEDFAGTDITSRDTLQFGSGLNVSDDSTNEKTVVQADVMQSGDMADILTPLPGAPTKLTKYSTEEQVVGEWIDGKPIYQISGASTTKYGNGTSIIESSFLSNHNVDTLIKIDGLGRSASYVYPFVSDGYKCLVIDNGNLAVNINSSTKTWSIIYTIQYTKTTD